MGRTSRELAYPAGDNTAMKSTHAHESIRPALPAEAETIAALVNQAYRPRQVAGWTHEAHLIAGERTRPDMVVDLIVRPGSLLLVAVVADAIVACVHLESRGVDCHIGMLAVHPARQGGGLGARMLAEAEHLAARRYAAKRGVLHVLRARTELLAYYLRRGYRHAGRQEAFPAEAGYGQPHPGADATLEVLVKPLAAE